MDVCWREGTTYGANAVFLYKSRREGYAPIYLGEYIGVMVVCNPKLKRPWVTMWSWDCIVEKDGGGAHYAEGRYYTKEEALAATMALYKMGYRGKYAVNPS